MKKKERKRERGESFYLLLELRMGERRKGEGFFTKLVFVIFLKESPVQVLEKVQS